jgi:hypothetical protein
MILKKSAKMVSTKLLTPIPTAVVHYYKRDYIVIGIPFGAKAPAIATLIIRSLVNSRQNE